MAKKKKYVVKVPLNEVTLKATKYYGANTANTANDVQQEGGGSGADAGLLSQLMGMLNSLGLMNGGMGGWPVGISKNAEAGHGYPMSRRSVTTRQPEWRRKDKPTPSQWDAIVNDTASHAITSVAEDTTGHAFDAAADAGSHAVGTSTDTGGHASGVG